MKSFKIAGYDCSEYVLGGAQLGQQYGVVNRTGIPSEKEILKMLSIAAEGGVRRIDTAAGYGSSEEMIGKALSQSKHLRNVFQVMTKLDHLKSADNMTDEELRHNVEKSVHNSCRNLRTEHLPVLFLHCPEHLTYRDGLIVAALEELHEQGVIGRLGVSADLPEDALAALDCKYIEALEIPVNPLNMSHIRAGVLDGCVQRSVQVFGRSVFLQGLLVRRPERNGKWPGALNDPVQRFHDIAAERGMVGAQLAVSYCCAFREVTGWIIGAETAAQVKENLEFFENEALDLSEAEKIFAEFQHLPLSLVLPAQWSSSHE